MVTTFLADLWPYLVAFYLVDAFVLLRSGQSLLLLLGGRVSRSAWGERGIRFTHLAPHAEVVLPYRPPLLVAGDRLLVRARDGAGGLRSTEDFESHPLAVGDVFGVEGREVLRKGRTLLETPSPRAARELADLLTQLAKEPLGGRLAFLERRLGERMDPERYRGLRGRVAGERSLLIALAWALFVGLFLALPAVVFSPASFAPGPVPVLALPVLALLLVLWGAVLVVSGRLLRKAGVADVLATLAPMLVCPPTAAHPLAVATKDLASGVDPLAAAAVLLPWGQLRLLLRRELSRLRLERLRLTPDLQPFLEVEERLVLGLAGRLGRTREDVLAPPEGLGPDESFCPLCLASYRPGFAECTDCGVALEAGPTSVAPSGAAQ